ncbi:helix-turn-helix transcriptional regulator [Streptomyces sp. NPDC050095]|uniref:helix-turn-helix transcriptional regulator n=1 Tax=unclassified Streptomyces TaxID=2593676 RepID=UPI00341356B8
MSGKNHTSEHPVSPELGPLLKHWRERLEPRRIPGINTSRRRLRPGLTQDEVASLTGVVSSWYRQLESPRPRPVSERFVQRLAMALRLDEAECVILYRLTLGRTPPMAHQHTQADAVANYQGFLDALLPHPAYLSNLWWDIIAHNRPQEDWFPWLPYERNLMRFAFLYPEAREQLVNWRTDWAAPFLAQIRYAIAMHAESKELLCLRDDILSGNSEAEELWSANEALAHPDGDVRRLKLPYHQDEEVQVRIMAFAPLGNPDLRAIVLLRL